MASYVALLRGINVSGHKLVKMDRLRSSLEGLGLSHVQTYLQSGNVTFQAPRKSIMALAASLQERILAEFKFPVPVLVLTSEALMVVLQENPFLSEKNVDPVSLHVSFLSEAPSPAGLKKLSAVAAGPDRYASVQSRIYLHCPQGYGNSKLSNQTLERVLGVTATTRNWKTINELSRMLEKS